jgi:hypothetical protein
MNWRKATDRELMVIMSSDPVARLSDIVEAREEWERRNRKIKKTRINWRDKVKQ